MVSSVEDRQKRRNSRGEVEKARKSPAEAAVAEGRRREALDYTNGNRRKRQRRERDFLGLPRFG